METRERVLALLKDGHSKAEIARQLGISKPAVGKHVAKLIEEGRWRKPTEAAPKAQEGKGRPLAPLRLLSHAQDQNRRWLAAQTNGGPKPPPPVTP
jgi:predicted ArsR family transcriptional regulator